MEYKFLFCAYTLSIKEKQCQLLALYNTGPLLLGHSGGCLGLCNRPLCRREPCHLPSLFVYWLVYLCLKWDFYKPGKPTSKHQSTKGTYILPGTKIHRHRVLFSSNLLYSSTSYRRTISLLLIMLVSHRLSIISNCIKTLS